MKRCGDAFCPCQDGDVCHYVTYPGTPAMRLPVSLHEKNLREMRCVVSMRQTSLTLHHCHGGSMLELGPEFPNPGGAQRANPFFQIPLDEEYHIGDYGVDVIGVLTWENLFGSQLEHLRDVNEELGYDIWEQARLWLQSNRPSGLMNP